MLQKSSVFDRALSLVKKVQAITENVLTWHIDRIDVVKAVWLSIVSRRPVFFLGSPGVDKTGTIEDMARQIAGAVFYDVLMPIVVSEEQLLVESTSLVERPTEDGGKEIFTRDKLGRAAGAHIFFADEIWKAQPQTLQAMLDLSKGDGVRRDGQMVKTPLLSFQAASNELPDPDGNLGAAWSRMTIRVVVNPLDADGKIRLVQARLNRARSQSSGSSVTQLTLSDIDTLRAARPHVEIPDDIVATVLDIYQELVDDTSQDFSWAWSDDRRFGRVFDVMQAHALLDGRTVVGNQDLAVLEWLLWDTPEHIPVVKAKVAPYCRTPLTEAQEVVDTLLSPSGTVALVQGGDRSKGVQAITQCEAALGELNRLKGAADTSMATQIETLITQVNSVKQDVIAVVTGAPRPTTGEAS